MTELSNEEKKIAKVAQEENEKLQKLLDEHSSAPDESNEICEDDVDLDSICVLTRKNDLLKGEIYSLRDEIGTCGAFSAVDIVNEYKHLKAKRAYLRNETQGLKNIRSHQIPKVREANRFRSDQQFLKLKNDEKNRILKDETKRLKERKEKEAEELSILNRREALLKEQLQYAVVASTDLNEQSLKAAIDQKDRIIRKLGDDIQCVLASKKRDHSRSRKSADNEVLKLREKYGTLRKRINLLQVDIGQM